VTTLLFWNVNKRADSKAIGRLCLERDVDVLLLAEAENAGDGLAAAINDAAGLPRSLWELQRKRCRVRVLTRYEPKRVTPVFEDRHKRILHLRHPAGMPILIVCAHLPSKLRSTDYDQGQVVRTLRKDLEEQERDCGHKNTLIIGDLNADPFEKCLTAVDGLNGVMDKAIARRLGRTVNGVSWDYFYNPMWSRLGDESSGPTGTYWYPGKGVVGHFWHTFDQVLLRPGLLPYYSASRLRVLDHVGEVPILRPRSKAGNLSDHLPLVLTLNMEGAVNNG
jgi:endonuclease/exonuclease/phosphatase family metal-dependent hydrolase